MTTTVLQAPTYTSNTTYNSGSYGSLTSSTQRLVVQFTSASAISLNRLELFGRTGWTQIMGSWPIVTAKVYKGNMNDVYGTNMSTYTYNTSAQISPIATTTIPLYQIGSTSDSQVFNRFYLNFAQNINLMNSAYIIEITVNGNIGAAPLYIAYGTKSGYKTYTYNGSWGESSNSTFVMSLIDYIANSAPTGITLSSSSIIESAAANATVGTLSATDAEGGAMTWALISGNGINDADNASFMIVGNTLKLANGVSLDYETKTQYKIYIQATDSGGLSYAEALTISITDDTSDNPLILGANLFFVNGKVVVNHITDPRVVPVRQNNSSPLPEGSVVKNTATTQKFIKINGTETSYSAISVAVPMSWDLSLGGKAAWDTLESI